MRSVHAGKGWAGFANGKSLGLAWPDAMTEAQAMRWVEKQIAEELARLVLEKSAPLGAKPGVTVMVKLDGRDLAEAMKSAASPSTYDEDDAGTPGSSR